MAVDPRGADLERYLRADPGGPAVMLGLLRYTEEGRARDAVRLVRSPAREAFGRMVADPESHELSGLRTGARTDPVRRATRVR